MKRIGLALGGGGARGLCHIEFCKALDELGLKPSIISGTSMGAIVGGFYAAGVSGQEMTALVDNLGFVEYTKMLDFSILSRAGLVKGKAVIDFFEKHLPVKTFENLEIPMKIVATDFWNRKEVVFQSGDLLQAIRASISVPGIFEPVKIDGVMMIDGDAVNPLPMNIIRNACDILIAIDVTGTNRPPKKRPVPTIFESVMTTFHIMESAVIRNQLSIFKPEIYIKPVLENVQLLEFHRDREIMGSVQGDVESFKRELEAKLKEPSHAPKEIEKKRFHFWK